MECDNACCVAKLSFGQLHLLAGDLGQAVYSAYKQLAILCCFGMVSCVLELLGQIVLCRNQTRQVRHSFFFVFGISDEGIQTAPHQPDFGRGHRSGLFLGRLVDWLANIVFSSSACTNGVFSRE
ncbi:hypothetical protein [Allofournierella massiliensis]|uniref:hypothetical protein n=1 Tax=Allofournierella massiliensis TaxID=1650663 RepID=UPI0024B06B17|nr:MULTISPECIES: hypothetical protein [Fournierella]